MITAVIKIEVPGRAVYSIDNVVFDYNGTIAANGIINQKTREGIAKLCEILNVFVLTADTYGSAEKECKGLKVTLKTFPKNNASDFKYKVVKELGEDKTVCFGNGFNDIRMLEAAVLSIAVIGEEGLCSKLITSSDIVVKSIDDGINLLINQKSLIATMRG